MNLDELFKSKLDNSELIPSENVGKQLMRRLTFKEFLQFRPLKFNVYYMGAIVTVASAILLFTANQNHYNTGTEKPVNLFPGSGDSIQVSRSAKIIDGSVIQSVSTGNKVSGKKTDKPGLPEQKPAIKEPERPKINTDTVVINEAVPEKQAKINYVPKENNSRINFRSNIMASIVSSGLTGCAPLTVKFNNNSLAYTSCKWSFGEGGFSNEINPQWIFDVEGEYKVVLEVFGDNGESATASVIVTVHPRPLARFDFSPEKPVLPDDDIRFLNYSKNAVKFRWDFGDRTNSSEFEPDHRYLKYGSYNVRLIAMSEYGCSDTMLLKNAFAESGCYIKFPNAFIPGTGGPIGGFYSAKSDESAGIFHPTTSGVTEYHLKIFSKMGILIFESNDINIGWDGYHKGQLCDPGVYIWKVRGTFRNGEPFVQMGDLTILRN